MSTITAYAGNATDKQVVLRGYTASTGLPYTSGAYDTSGIAARYRRQGANAEVTITLATQTVNGAHADGGFVHISGGAYRLDLPDAAVASGSDYVEVWVYGITDVVFSMAHIDIMGADPRSSTVDASAATSAVTSAATASSTADSANLSSIALRATSAHVSTTVSTAQSAGLSSATASSTADSSNLSSIALRATSANVSASVSTAQSAGLSSATASSTADSSNLSSIALRATSANVSTSVSTAQSAALSSATAASTAQSTTLSQAALAATSANVSAAASVALSGVILTPSQVMSVALSSNGIAANIKRVNDVVVNGNGAGTPWGP